MSKSLFTLILVTLLGGAAFFWFSRDGEKAPIRIVSEPMVETLVEKASGPVENFDPISIQAFAAKNFDGHDFRVGDVQEKNAAYTRYFISYESAGLTISGIMNVPSGTGPFPVLFLNHGYIDPQIYTNGRGLRREQDYLARQGYVVVHSDFRNHAQSDREPDETVPDMRFGYAEDVVNGILALQKAELPYVAKDRIGMLGHSMGGGVAQIIAVAKPELVRAFVLFAPVSAQQKDNFEQWIKGDPEREGKNIARFGLPEDNPALWRNASPINFFDRVSAPMVFHHGTNDQDVPLEWSERAVKALEASGKEAKLYAYPGEPHEFAVAWPTVMARTVQFFDQWLKNCQDCTSK